MPKLPKGDTAVIVASINGHSDVVRELVKNVKVNVNASDQLGYTPLMVASEIC